MMGESHAEREIRYEQLAYKLREIWASEFEQFTYRKRGQATKYKHSKIWDGGTDAMGRKHRSVWDKVAVLLSNSEIRIDPEKFVKAQFEYRDTLDPPRPNILLSKVAFNKYREFCSKRAPDIKASLETQKQQFRLLLYKRQFLYNEDIATAADFILVDKTAALSALFRYCIARQINREAMTELWHDAALEQYLPDRSEYDISWGNLIPDEIRTTL